MLKITQDVPQDEIEAESVWDGYILCCKYHLHSKNVWTPGRGKWGFILETQVTVVYSYSENMYSRTVCVERLEH
jgi:hypothetical protein